MAAAPATYQQGLQDVLRQVSTLMATPDADLNQLGDLHQTILGIIRKPFDTASPGSPVAGGQANMSSGMPQPASPPPGPGLDILS